MTWTVATHLAYLLIALPLTMWVAMALSRNGHVLLTEAFRGEDGQADAINRLLVVGFYLINLGFVVLYIRGGGEVDDLNGLLETLSLKIGVVMLVLGVLHFINVLMFTSMRRRGRAEAVRAQQAAAYYAQFPAQYPTQTQR